LSEQVKRFISKQRPGQIMQFHFVATGGFPGTGKAKKALFERLY